MSVKLLHSDFGLTALMKGVQGKYELVILHHSHFLIDNSPVVIKHPLTENFANFYASGLWDGTLCEGSPTGDHLPPFGSRGGDPQSTPLNPILVNWAAHIHLRRCMKWLDEVWMSWLDPHVHLLFERIIKHHALVLWNPNKPPHEDNIVVVSGSNTFNLEGWRAPEAKPEASQPGPSSQGSTQGAGTS